MTTINPKLIKRFEATTVYSHPARPPISSSSMASTAAQPTPGRARTTLGGILLKRALLYSNDVRDPALEIQRSLYVSTYGIIFLGTPHTGSNLASWGRILQAMSGVVPKKILNTEPVLLKTLKKDNVVLQEINNHFLDIYQRFKIHMVRENKKTDLKYTVDYVVDNKSAGPQLPGVTYYSIEATHSTMCKFETAESPGYSNVSSAIRDWIQEAPDSIQMRWTLEEEERNARAMNAFNQMAKQLGSPLPAHPVASPSPAVSPAPLTIHPYQFKPNAYFKGRESELEQLHSYLRNPDRLAAGTSAVLLQSLPGGGKSHLARQYIQIHGSSYPGGVFWIRAKSEQEMADAFWKIASSKIIQDSDDQSWRRGALEPNKMVETVRRWFESFEGWLIVFDGIHFDGRHEPDFIPHAKNTSILYTSTNRAATGDYRFDNPMLMELGQLSKEQAQELLLEEMGKQPPFHKFDLLQAGKAHLKVTREPLAKYTRSFNHTREAGILDAYKNVKEDLQRRGAVEALNLVHILCFFAPIIPVEMLVLGLGALDNRTPIKTADAFNRKSINNTLSILIRYALVGRNEDDGGSNTSSPNKHRHGHTKRMAPEFLDTLRIHSIIQRFFRNDLGSSRQIAFWLERAIAVYCRSFDVANVRIGRSSRVGLPDDYRRYRIHGEQLLKHVDRLVKKHESLLGECKLQLEERLDLVEVAVENLTKVVSIDIMSGRVDKVPKSVFEISSSSCSDSSSSRTSDRATPVREDGEEGGVGARDGRIGAWVFHEEAGVVESPGIYDDMAHHDWHDFPYPRVNMIPMPLLPEDLDPSDTEYSRTPRPPMPFYGEGKSRDDPAHHRTVKKMEERRYNDRKASMREMGGMTAATVGPAADPRIHVTHDNAKGRMFNSMPSDLTEDEAAAVRAERERRSEAKSQLMRISSAQSLAGAVSGGASSSPNASNNGNGNNNNRSHNILQLLTMAIKRNVGQKEGYDVDDVVAFSKYCAPDLRSPTASGPSSYGVHRI
ncbi:unnamed protein product [Parascedosporium putredinis]|uniref:NB-ARC domain-containing protein n=1 Tax=Parascedosporium putredinis TaxID=1442378 RepID=A0A9P1H2Y3_9PEZI|nr:unnamed protein product [Parascedosporium putredinis]CAI7994683.1 unnamed protein product [Parascedosporium putredinis]